MLGCCVLCASLNFFTINTLYCKYLCVCAYALFQSKQSFLKVETISYLLVSFQDLKCCRIAISRTFAKRRIWFTTSHFILFLNIWEIGQTLLLAFFFLGHNHSFIIFCFEICLFMNHIFPYDFPKCSSIGKCPTYIHFSSNNRHIQYLSFIELAWMCSVTFKCLATIGNIMFLYFQNIWRL